MTVVTADLFVRFNDNAASAVVVEANGANGALSSGNSQDYYNAGGKFGGCLTGIGAYTRINNFNGKKITGPRYMVCSWNRVFSGVASDHLWGQGYSGGASRMSAATSSVSVKTNDTAMITEAVNWGDNGWHQTIYACDLDAGFQCIWVDGVKGSLGVPSGTEVGSDGTTFAFGGWEGGIPGWVHGFDNAHLFTNEAAEYANWDAAAAALWNGGAGVDVAYIDIVTATESYTIGAPAAAVSTAYHSEPRWLFTMTDGVTQLFYSDRDFDIQISAGAAYAHIKGRVTSCSPVKMECSAQRSDTGFDITILDPDNELSTNNVGKDWYGTFAVGFADLSYASWPTLGRWYVEAAPKRSGRYATLRLATAAVKNLGKLTDYPTIEAADVLFFTTLDTEPSRIGERLPMRFGPWFARGGAIECPYLGTDGTYMWFAVTAYDKTATTTSGAGDTDVLDAYVDGRRISNANFVAAHDTTGNYKVICIKFTLAQAAYLGVIDPSEIRRHNSFREGGGTSGFTRRRPAERGGIRRNGDVELVPGAYEIKGKVSCNARLGWGAPVEMLTYLMDNHGVGSDGRDTSSWTACDTACDALGIVTSYEVKPDDTLGGIVNAVCAELPITQRWTSAGKLVLELDQPVTKTQSQAGSSSDTYGALYSDLNEVVSEPELVPQEGGEWNPVNTVALQTHEGNEEIALTAYYADAENREVFAPKVVRNLTLARSLAWWRMARNGVYSSVACKFMASFSALWNAPGDLKRVTARSAASSFGGEWSSRPCRIRSLSWLPLEYTVEMVVQDRYFIDHLQSAYVTAAATYPTVVDERTTITGVSGTATDRYLTTTNPDAAGLLPGEFVALMAYGLYARVLRVVVSGGTYTIYLDRLVPTSFTSQTVLAIGGLTAYGRIANATDGYRVNENIGTAAALSDTKMCFLFCEQGAIPFVDSGYYASTSAVRTLTEVGSPSRVATAPVPPLARCPSLNGTSQYLHLGLTTYWADLITTGAVTVWGWFIPATNAGDNVIVQNGHSGATTAKHVTWKVYWENATRTLKFMWHDASTNEVIASSAAAAFAFDALCFFACVRSASGTRTATIYVGTMTTAPVVSSTTADLAEPNDGSAGILTIGADHAGANFAKVKPGILGMIAAVQDATAVYNLWNYTRRATTPLQVCP